MNRERRRKYMQIFELPLRLTHRISCCETRVHNNKSVAMMAKTVVRMQCHPLHSTQAK